MASSGGLMPLKKQLLPHNFDAKNRYSCLNLNQIRQCSNVSIVHSKSKSISKNKGFGKHKCCCSLTIRHNIFGLQQHQKIDSKIVADENSRSLWNKSSSITLHSNPFKSFTEFDEAEATVKTKRWKNYSVNATSTTSSTLSLHIAAYENFVEGGDTVTLDKNKCSKKDVINGQKQTLVDSALNPIEFPRQQTADETDPAVMQFTASQQLLNPNQLGSSLDNQRRPPSSAQNRGSESTRRGESSDTFFMDSVEKKFMDPAGFRIRILQFPPHSYQRDDALFFCFYRIRLNSFSLSESRFFDFFHICDMKKVVDYYYIMLKKGTMNKLSATQQSKIVSIKSKRGSGYKEELKSCRTGLEPPSTWIACAQFADKNRYSNIFCLDKTRVKLSTGNYINANLVQLSGASLILAQAPMNETAEDFVQMLFDQKIEQIFMLCQFVEGGREKCYEYFFKKGVGQKRIGKFVVDVITETYVFDDENKPKKDLIKRIIDIEDTYVIFKRVVGPLLIRYLPSLKKAFRRSKSRIQIVHYQFTQWPDHKDVKDTRSLLLLIKIIVQHKRGIVIHCSAGIGRTGTLATAAIAYLQFQNQKFSSMFNTLSEIRKQRCQSVQTPVQYFMVHILFIQTIENLLMINLAHVKKEMRKAFNETEWKC